jgi:two-component system, OmpR family, sensor kinase
VRSLRFKIGFMLVLLALLIVTPSVFAWRSLQEGSFNADRSRQAHEVLDAHLLLAERGYRLLHYVDHSGSAADPAGQELNAEVQQQATKIRKLIAAEVALIGKGGIDEEEEELIRIDAISESLARAVAGQADEKWQTLIDEAVAEERREVAIVDAQTQKAFKSVQWLIIVLTSAVALIAAMAFFWFQRSLAGPINDLLAGTRALANGDYWHRVKPRGDAEFRELGDSFNRMAAQMQSTSTALESDNDALEAMVAERTGELASANDRLSEAAERRNQFLTDISHELRTPLAIIRGEAEVTLRGQDKEAEEYRSSLSRVADQVQGMARLVDDLLYVARSEAGAPKLKMRPVNLRKLVETATRDLRVLIEADDGRIRLNAPGTNAQVLGDGDRLSQLIHILLDNAIHYSEGPPEITVSVLPSPDGYIVMVSDQGIGIAEDDLPNVFDRYHRGRLANQQNGGGIGIGLPMAKSIAEGHGGTITIESEQGEGTTVKVFLPGIEAVRAVA